MVHISSCKNDCFATKLSNFACTLLVAVFSHEMANVGRFTPFCSGLTVSGLYYLT